MTAQEKINQIYKNVQHFQFQPTEHNVMLAADILIKLKDLYSEVDMMAQMLAEAQNQAQEPGEDGHDDRNEEDSMLQDGRCYAASEDALDGNPPAVAEDEI